MVIKHINPWLFTFISILQLWFITPRNHHQKTHVTLGGQRKPAISKQNTLTVIVYLQQALN